MHFDLTSLRLQSAEFRYTQFIASNLENWVNSTIIESVLAFARAANHEESYRSHLSYVPLGPLEFNVEFDYTGPNGEPLGLWLEKGTRAHIIRAVIADALRWIDRRTGKTRFAKWVRHPGTKGIRAMERGAKSGIPRLENMIIAETNTFLQETKMV